MDLIASNFNHRILSNLIQSNLIQSNAMSSTRTITAIYFSWLC